MAKLEAGQVWKGRVKRSIYAASDREIRYTQEEGSCVAWTTPSAFNAWIARTEAKLEGRDGG